jgi:hypothetical protein
MITDRLSTFLKDTALNTGAANTYLIGSQYDMQDVRDLGNLATPLWWGIIVTTSVDSAGDGVTLKFSLASDDSASISTSTSTVHLQTPVFAQATLVAGYSWWAPLPLEGNLYERFLGVLQTTAVEAVTAGKITSLLTINPGKWKPYADAVN